MYEDFPKCNIKKQLVRCTIEYDVALESTEMYEVARTDFEEAINMLQCQGGTHITWHNVEGD